ncbi:alcohol dehydrogenase catalytic domain-containing protein [Salicibibacter kimchii]|uniref:Alcohol dehydrogenase n=1 Tax=Salicibibacter kimchii TaxID=2099786 RepID=A0A345BW71_9BACI|nr:alcohol dehydrogenase catalytic domain-containing protein [Salicibibacter kimchii]AXF55202.1 alcohol dehydrogenase [Salicibibacter kimchii]
MKAILLEEFNKDLKVTNIQEPNLSDEGVIVKIKANGICRSDWHIWKGHWKGISTPLVMGHEFTGIVEAVGSNVKKFKKGDRVIIPFSLSCGHCEYCLDGSGNVCTERQSAGITFNGGYGEFAHVPLADFNLAYLPEEIDFVSGAAMGCRFATSFHGIVNQAKVGAGEWVVVSGCGGVGLSALQFSVAMGANVICVDIDDRKLNLAKDLGASFVINSKESNVVDQIKEITNGGADVTIDALGNSEIVMNSLNSLKKKGRHLQLGIAPDNVNFDFQVRTLVNFEHQIIGSRGMPPQKFPYMLNMVKSNRLKPKDLVTKTVSPDQVNDVLQGMGSFDNLGITVLEW